MHTDWPKHFRYVYGIEVYIHHSKNEYIVYPILTQFLQYASTDEDLVKPASFWIVFRLNLIICF